MIQKNTLYKSSIIAAVLGMILLGQNCSKVDFQNSSDLASKAGEEESVNGESGLPADPPTENENPDQSEEQQWLNTNCDPAKLKGLPATFNYSPTGAAVKDQQKKQNDYVVNGAKSVELQQLDLTNLKISKSGDVKIQQIHASRIEVEALSISKFQQLFANEIFLKTARIDSANLQQLGSPYLYVEANVVDANIQQLSALCLATQSVQTIQQVKTAHVVGRASGGVKASIEKVQQLRSITIEDTNVGQIQQVQEVTLRNVHVDSVQQVGKLTLINSTVGKMQSVGQVINK